VIGATVLIIEIIGMLPHVETNEGGHIFGQRTIAARRGDDREPIIVLREPPPA
jgi:hypothetical protein